MAGCYKKLTGKLEKGDVEKHLERAMRKQAEGKKLNGWDKTVLRMKKYAAENSEDFGKVKWANEKINKAVSEAKKYSSKF